MNLVLTIQKTQINMTRLKLNITKIRTVFMDIDKI